MHTVFYLLVLGGSEVHQEVIFQRNTSADLEQVFDTILLSEQRVDDGGFISSSGGLAKVTEDAQDVVESVEISFVVSLPFDSFQQFSEEDKIEDDGSGQEGVFTDVVDGPGLFTAQEDFRDVFVDGLLGITSTGDVLDDDFVVGVFTLLEQAGVGSDDIISAGLLGGFLGLEGLFGREVLTVVVTQMVITDDRDGLKTTTNDNVDEGSLELSLTSLEIVTDNEGVVLDSQFNETIN